MSFKSFVRENPIYKRYILPMRKSINAYIESKLDDEAYFIRRHKKIFGYTPDFKNPQTFNEKIVHRILYDRNPLYTALADKLKARIYIAAKLANLDLESETECMSKANQSKELKEKFQALADSPTFLDPKSSSPLFAPIDTLTQLLFDTNVCPFLPKLYGIYKSVEDINFDELPNSFVLKTNHDGGGVVIVPNKEAFLRDSKAFREAMEKLTKHLNTNFYTLFREWHYKNIEPKVFAEELLGESVQIPQTQDLDSQKIENGNFHTSLQNFKVPDDYKINQYGEQILFIEVDSERFSDQHTRAMFDKDFNKLPFQFSAKNLAISKHSRIPKNSTTLLQISKILAEPLRYVRIDLYSLTNRIVVGELTFTPAGGTSKFYPTQYDKFFGNLWITNPFPKISSYLYGRMGKQPPPGVIVSSPM
ncbi:ATP-grasp fold amidoligase family protein [uncultured Helicobacter sp.]|uniref:ATP-grasp fold amidoligase family protein n=1 Tax=uncultured Helicobacter sp. TaxID=175537 RepID=UPI00374FC2BE